MSELADVLGDTGFYALAVAIAIMCTLGAANLLRVERQASARIQQLQRGLERGE